MAGIGFELRKVVNKGGIGSFFQIAMSGAMIVAGPWILSIVTIILIQTFLNQALSGSLELFMGIVIYCYAFSLFLFGGFHYIFTRRMSDLLYINKESQAFGYVLRLCIPISLASIAIALPAALSLNLNIPHAALFRFSTVLIFTTVNSLWIIMLFVSVLKWYIKIMLVYTGGLATSLLLIYLLSRQFGVAGALLGFSLGHLIIVLLLMFLCRIAWKPARPEPPADLNTADTAGGRRFSRVIADFFRYIYKHRFLFAAGTLYYWGIWIDKMIFWLTSGKNISGTFIKLFSEYDIPVYLANLTMIPGLIFFIIYSETEFYTALKRFLLSISQSRYSSILLAKKRLTKVTLYSLKEQSLLQGIVSLTIILFSSGIILKTTLSAVFFHLLLLTLMNYLFYIEQYKHAFYSALIFFGVNSLLSLMTAVGIIPAAPGLSYLTGAASASITAGFLLKHDLIRLDRHILTKK